jgi:predicted O-methyltransferase YrrM
MFRSKVHRLLVAGVEAAASVARPILNRVESRQAKDIPLERDRRALASTVDYVQRHMRQVKPAGSRLELLTRAFGRADITGDRLICEFGVYTGSTINHLATLTPKKVFGFDSFEGLPEAWGHRVAKGHFAVRELPRVRDNVTLIKGWFSESLPGFLKEHSGTIGFLHIDCDLYSSTKTVFDLLEPRLAAGTVIAFDEYFNYPEWEEGEFKAFSEFISRTGLSFEFIGYHCKGEQVAVVVTQR